HLHGTTHAIGGAPSCRSRRLCATTLPLEHSAHVRLDTGRVHPR
ncbi:hypothetical protein NGA_2003100, partial [Nannochloropsis gaditana CCMP526]